MVDILSGLHKHKDMAAASIEEGINPRQGRSCENEGIQGILPQSAYPLSSLLLSSPLLSSPFWIAVTDWLLMSDHSRIDSVGARGQTPCL